MKRLLMTIALSVIVFGVSGSLIAQCRDVGGVLMTNIGAIAGVTNLGPVFGDLEGSVAATIMGQDNNGNFLIQHYWVNSAGETIKFKLATLVPGTASVGGQVQSGIVPVLWGNYVSDIQGGTGKYQHAHGSLLYFGIADFNQLTLVLRYRGTVCLGGGDSRD